jgi:hypothetical protein
MYKYTYIYSNPNTFNNTNPSSMPNANLNTGSLTLTFNQTLTLILIPGNVAHDLNTPLQCIGLSLENLRTELNSKLRLGLGLRIGLGLGSGLNLTFAHCPFSHSPHSLCFLPIPPLPPFQLISTSSPL